MTGNLLNCLLQSGLIRTSTTYPIRQSFDKAGWLKDKKKRKAAKKARKKNR